MIEWIDYSEEKPKEAGDYLLFMEGVNDVGDMCCYYCSMKYTLEQGFYPPLKDKISHWFKLAEPVFKDEGN